MFCDDFLPYDEFLLEAAKYAFEAGKGNVKKIYSDTAKLVRFLETYLQDHQVHLCVENNANTRKVLGNVSDTVIRYGNIYRLSVMKSREAIELVYPEENLLSVIRVRRSSNHEVPDYYRNFIPSSDKEKRNYEYSEGIFERSGTYYSLDASPKKDKESEKVSVGSKDKTYTHRRLLEMFPLSVQNKDEVEKELYLVHNLRSSLISYTEKTILPLPLEIIDPDRLKEYMTER